MKKLIYSAIVFSFFACNNNTTGKEPAAKDTLLHAEETKAVEQATTVYNELVDTAIVFHFDKDSTTLTATGKISKPSDRITGLLDVDRKVDFQATLIKSSPDMNLRFSEIIRPDGTSDGPFGQEIKAAFTQKGLYKIIISPSNMASGKTRGDFQVRISATPKL